MPEVPTRAHLVRAELFKVGGRDKADLLTLDLGDGPMVIKDFARKSWWVRWIGRLQISREWRAYRWLGPLPGIPRLIGRIDPHALAVEKIDGDSLAAPGRVAQGAECFARLRAILDRVHAAGLVHLDLRARKNVLVRGDGEVIVVDFASALWLRPGSLAHRLFFDLLRNTDRSALLKWKEILQAGPYSAEEQAFLERHRLLRRLWPFNRRRKRR